MILLELCTLWSPHLPSAVCDIWVFLSPQSRALFALDQVQV